MWIIPSYPKLGAVLHISFTFTHITYSISKLMQFYYLKISRIYPIISITTDTQYIGMFHVMSHNTSLVASLLSHSNPYSPHTPEWPSNIQILWFYCPKIQFEILVVLGPFSQSPLQGLSVLKKEYQRNCSELDCIMPGPTFSLLIELLFAIAILLTKGGIEFPASLMVAFVNECGKMCQFLPLFSCAPAVIMRRTFSK